MPRSIRDVARLLLLAGGAGLPALCPAAPPPTPTAAVLLVSPEQLRSEAARVELAWLANPALYHLPLTVRVQGQGLEVSGQVPDEEMRQQVLQTARQSCYLPIHDTLAVTHAGRTPIPKEQLLGSAREVLTRQLGTRAASMQAAATADGQIVLRGEVASLEDKLAASRALRGLAGCSRVVNRLSVRGGSEFARDTVAGEPAEVQQVKATQIEPATSDPVPVPQVQQAATAPYVAPPNAATIPSGLPSVRYQVVEHGYGPQLVSLPSPAAPTSDFATGAQPAAPSDPVATETKQSFKERLLHGWRTPPRPTVKRDAPSPVVTPAPAPTSATPFQPVVVPVSPPTVATAAPKAPEPPPAAQATAWPPAHHIRPATSWKFQPSRPLARTAQATAQPVPPPPPPAAMPTPPAPVHPVSATERTLPPIQTAAVTPVAQAPASSVAVSPTPTPSVSVNPADLQRKVARAAGKKIDRVRVEATTAGYTVHVYQRRATDQELLPVLLQVPELAASNVQLNVHLQP